MGRALTSLAVLWLGVAVGGATQSSVDESLPTVDQRLTELEKKVVHLEERVTTLEQKQGPAQPPPKQQPQPPSLEQWRKLRFDMTENHVRQILGEPLQIAQGSPYTRTYWFYSLKGREGPRVEFAYKKLDRERRGKPAKELRLVAWTEPKAPKP